MRTLAALVLAALVALAPGLAARAATPPAQGPAWWKVSNGGGSTLWILAMPDGLLSELNWNHDELHQKIKSSRLLLSPSFDETLAFVPASALSPQAGGVPRFEISTVPGRATDPRGFAGFWAGEMGVPGLTDRTLWSDPLSRRLPPALLARLNKAVGGKLSGPDSSQFQHAPTYIAALWQDVWNWPAGTLGNPVVRDAQRYAVNIRTPVTPMYLPALWRPVPVAWASAAGFSPESGLASQSILVIPPQSVQQACLTRALDERDAGIAAARQAAMQAWAVGDVAHALRRSGDIQLCLMGNQPGQDATAFWRSQAFLYEQYLDAAFDEKGDTVALVEFDPLLVEGGILTYYKSRGFDIEAPPGA